MDNLDIFSPIRPNSSFDDSKASSDGSSASGSVTSLSNTNLLFSPLDDTNREKALDDVFDSEQQAKNDEKVVDSSKSSSLFTPVTSRNPKSVLNEVKVSPVSPQLKHGKKNLYKNILKKNSEIVQLQQESVHKQDLECYSSKSESTKKPNLISQSASKNGEEKGDPKEDIDKQHNCLRENMKLIKKVPIKNSLEALTDGSLQTKKRKENSTETVTEFCKEPSAIIKSSNLSDQKENSELALESCHKLYEEKIEKMVKFYIEEECAKLRQMMYSQQWAFYRELFKLKDEMEQQHAEMTERLVKVIEELMQMRNSLKGLLECPK